MLISHFPSHPQDKTCRDKPCLNKSKCKNVPVKKQQQNGRKYMCKCKKNYIGLYIFSFPFYFIIYIAVYQDFQSVDT